MQQKELISYFLVDTNSADSITPLAQTEDVDGFLPLCIELQGADLLRLGKAFLFWRTKALEIIYRPQSTQKAMVIFSRLSEEEYFREADIIPPVLWPEQKLVALKESWKSDLEKAIKINLESESTLDKFLEKLYAINPTKDKVVFEGVVQPYLFLLALDWFANSADSIWYHDERFL
jgi:hypothetical protein